MKSFIHLIRHGTTLGNQKRMFYGHTDLPLTDEGIGRIKTLIEEGVYPKPDNAVYYTSGLLRAEQTLSLIYGKIPHIRLDGFKEMYFGDYEMKTHEELLGDSAYISWINDKTGISAPPEGESALRFISRVKNQFQFILDEHLSMKNISEEKHSVIVCHAGVICVIMATCFDGDTDDMFKWITDPGRGYTIAIENGGRLMYTTF